MGVVNALHLPATCKRRGTHAAGGAPPPPSCGHSSRGPRYDHGERRGEDAPCGRRPPALGVSLFRSEVELNNPRGASESEMCSSQVRGLPTQHTDHSAQCRLTLTVVGARCGQNVHSAVNALGDTLALDAERRPLRLMCRGHAHHLCACPRPVGAPVPRLLRAGGCPRVRRTASIPEDGAGGALGARPARPLRWS